MSFMLQFPPQGPLPKNVRTPPYVLFGINGVDHFNKLPPKIPLELVIHFAPRLRQYILPAPVLTRAGINQALRIPYVSIDIIDKEINIVGLKWIVHTMFQAAGLPISPPTFLHPPSIHEAISIHKAWLALNLHAAGLDGLHIHLQMELSMGGPVTLDEIKKIWAAFPSTSPIVLAMGLNFVRSHLNFAYTQPEFSRIRHWYLDTSERYKFFAKLESKFPEFEDVQDVLVQNILTERLKEQMEGKGKAPAPSPSENRSVERVAVRGRRLSRKRSGDSVGSAGSPSRKPASRQATPGPQQAAAVAAKTAEALEPEKTGEEEELSMLLQNTTFG